MQRKSPTKNPVSIASRLLRRRQANSQLRVLPLERRDVPTTTPFNLAGGDLMQNWTDPSLIATDDNWDGVPSIVGYQGSLSNTTQSGVDPQTIVTDPPTFPGVTPPPGLVQVLDVFANLTDPTGFFTGGVAEFEITDPSIALNGSGTSDAPHLIVYLDTTGRQDIRIQYTTRDLDASGDDAIMRIALQYRVGSTGDFINLPAGFVADATMVNSATQTNTVDVTLPADADNQALVQVRVISANAVGNDEWVGIDDIVVSSVPRISAGVLQFSASMYTVADESGTATITVTRTGGTVGAVSVQYATSDDTATAGSDYTATSGTLNFIDGQTSATFTIPIIDDSIQEPTESLTITLSNPTGGATLGTTNPATLNIIDNDAPGALQFSAANFRRGENGGTATITVTRTGGTGGAVSAQYATSDGTATAGSDYTAASGTLNFAAGQASAIFGVTLADDTSLEGGETINLTLSTPTGGATLGTPSTSLLTILDNDALLNEIEVDPPGTGAAGTDEPFEYVELRGTPGASLTGYYFVAVEGESPAIGVFELVVDLTGASFGTNGLLILKAPGGAGHAVIDPATTVVEVPEFANVGGALENFTNSFLLVRATTAPVVGTDYDADDALVGEGGQFLGSLEVFEAGGGQVIDGVGFLDSAPANDRVYGVEFPSTFQFPAPAAATRLPTDTTPLSVAAFYYGELTFTTNTELNYDPQPGFNNAPAGAVLTPGGANFGAPAGPPTVLTTQVNGGNVQRSRVTTLAVTFSTAVTFAGPVANAFTLTRNSDNAIVNFTATAAVNGLGQTVVTLDNFVDGTANITEFGSLADGSYTLTTLANQVSAGGVNMAANDTFGDVVGDNFFRFYGDITGDRRVDIADFSFFSPAYLQGPGANNPVLDYNQDGRIDIADFSQFSVRYFTTLP